MLEIIIKIYISVIILVCIWINIIILIQVIYMRYLLIIIRIKWIHELKITNYNILIINILIYIVIIN